METKSPEQLAEIVDVILEKIHFTSQFLMSGQFELASNALSEAVQILQCSANLNSDQSVKNTVITK